MFKLLPLSKPNLTLEEQYIIRDTDLPAVVIIDHYRRIIHLENSKRAPEQSSIGRPRDFILVKMPRYITNKVRVIPKSLDAKVEVLEIETERDYSQSPVRYTNIIRLIEYSLRINRKYLKTKVEWVSKLKLERKFDNVADAVDFVKEIENRYGLVNERVYSTMSTSARNYLSQYNIIVV